jgi:hypothetical protein
MAKTLTKTKVIRISGNFIRNAISEKIKREYKELIEKSKKIECPF